MAWNRGSEVQTEANLCHIFCRKESGDRQATTILSIRLLNYLIQHNKPITALKKTHYHLNCNSFSSASLYNYVLYTNSHFKPALAVSITTTSSTPSGSMISVTPIFSPISTSSASSAITLITPIWWAAVWITERNMNYKHLTMTDINKVSIWHHSAYNLLRCELLSCGVSDMVTSPSSSGNLDLGPGPPPPPWPPRCFGLDIWSLYMGALKGPRPLRLRCFGTPTRSSCSVKQQAK